MWRHGFIMLLMLGLYACAGISDTAYKLDSTMFAYERAMRWGDYDVAYSAHVNEKGPLSSEERKRLNRFRVTGYTAAQAKFVGDTKHAIQLVELRYYNEENVRERILNVTVAWEYDDAGNRWQITSPFPSFK